MVKASGWIVAAGLILCGGMRAYGQPEMEAREQLLQEAAPEYYAFKKQLKDISMRIEKVVARLAKDEIYKDQAKAQLLPLVEQELKIRNDPEFLVEQRLAQVVLSSPEYQRKMKDLTLKFSAKGKSQR